MRSVCVVATSIVLFVVLGVSALAGANPLIHSYVGTARSSMRLLQKTVIRSADVRSNGLEGVPSRQRPLGKVDLRKPSMSNSLQTVRPSATGTA